MKRAHIIPNVATTTAQPSEPEYISYQMARQILAGRICATPEEIAMWAFFKKRFGGLDPYASCKPAPYDKAKKPPRLHPPTHDQISPSDSSSQWLASAYFRNADIKNFNPKTRRYIPWKALLARWQAHGITESETLIKVRGLIGSGDIDEPVAPIFGLTEISWSGLAPAEWALFMREQIEAIEKRDFPVGIAATQPSQPAVTQNVQAIATPAGGINGERSNPRKYCVFQTNLDTHSTANWTVI